MFVRLLQRKVGPNIKDNYSLTSIIHSSGLAKGLRKVTDLLFGYDFFISYAHADGLCYPQTLADRLQEMGYLVFLDTREYVPGVDLRLATRRRLRMSKKLILIARPHALASNWVRREVEACLNARRIPIVVDVNRTLEDAPDEIPVKQLLRDKLFIRESVDEFDAEPSPRILDELVRSFRSTRQEELRLRLVSIAAAVLVVVTAAALWKWWEADVAKDEAEEQAQISLSRQLSVQAFQMVQQPSEFNGHLDRALLLAVEAVRAKKSYEARNILLRAVQSNSTLIPYPRSVLRGHNEAMDGGPTFGAIPAFSSDGKHLASGGADGTVRLWDVMAGRPLGKPLRGHSEAVTDVEISPDGKTLVSASLDQTVRLWDTSTGEPKGEPLRGHEDIVWVAVFSPDGETVASASEDKTIRLWDVMTGSTLGEPLRGHTGAVTAVAFSPNGDTLASASEDKTVRLWDTATGELKGEPLRGHEGYVNNVAFSPDGETLASASTDKKIKGSSLDINNFK